MRQPIRILHILANRPTGGIEAYLLNMHRNIDKTKIQFDYIVCDEKKPGEFDKKIEQLGGKVFVLSPLNHFGILTYITEMNNFFKNHKEYKIVHGHFTALASIYLIIAKINGIKIRIIHSHSINYSDYWVRAARNFLLQLPLKIIANRFVASSKESAEFLFGKKNVKLNRVTILNNAIDASKFQFDEAVRKMMRKKLNIENKFVIGHVGRFVPAKNHKFLIDIFNEVYNKNSDSVLLLVGSGELLEEIKIKVKNMGLNDAVIFAGNRSDVSECIQAFDIFLLPSLYEGLGIVAIEAQAAGLRIIASKNIPKSIQITELVQFISLKSKITSWADEILKHDNYKRTNKYHRIVESGYDVKSEAKRLEQYYFRNFEELL